MRSVITAILCWLLASPAMADEETFASFDLTIRNTAVGISAGRIDDAIYDLTTVLINIDAHRHPGQTDDEDVEQVEAILGRIPMQSSNTGTTCVATTLRAGHTEKRLPQAATVTVHCRVPPGASAGDVRQILFNVGDSPSLEIEVLGEAPESPTPLIRPDLTVLVTDATNAHYGEVPIMPLKKEAPIAGASR